MLNGCETCGWVQRNESPRPLSARCPRCGRQTSQVRYEAVYGPSRRFEAGAGRAASSRGLDAPGAVAEGDSSRC